jgi:hypothetical protein
MSAFPIRCFLAVAAVGLLAGACANANTTSAANAVYVAQAPAVQVESDGLPVQAAPSALIRQMPDDPSQPFSPNYGGANPARAIPSVPTVKPLNDAVPAKAAMSTPIPTDLPPTFRRQLVAATDASG